MQNEDSIMKKIAIALLASTVLAAPAAFAASNGQPQQPQGQQTQNQKPMQDQGQNNSNNQQGQNGQQAQNNQPIDAQGLSRTNVRQVQRALDKDGFKAGPTDGRWGNETQNAVKQFQQSKQIQATGQLDQQTVADLGLDASKFSQSQGQK
jgi:Ni/Co efflux regulator RcnB